MHFVTSLREASTDVRLLWLSVFLRMAAYGLTNQVLTLHLALLGVSEPHIGLFMTLTLVGDTTLSYFLTWYADRLGRRLVMRVGCLLMMASGLVFAVSSHYWLLLAAAVVGVISPLGDETGPFKSIEEAAIAHLTPVGLRPEVYAMHWMFSTAGAALGSLLCGFWVETLVRGGWTHQEAYRFSFGVYGALAGLKLLLMAFLSPECEVLGAERPEVAGQEGQAEPLLPPTPHTAAQLLAQTLPQQTVTGLLVVSQRILFRLLFIFMLDSFGYGFMTQAWVVYYFKTVFGFSAAALGVLYCIINITNSLSSLPLAYMARALGPVRAMVWAQAPAALCYALIPLCGPLWLPAAALLLLNAAGSTMDVVPRQILLTGLFAKDELTRVLGVVNVGKTLARCVGPMCTGRLASAGFLAAGYMITGGCILISDTLLWWWFK